MHPQQIEQKQIVQQENENPPIPFKRLSRRASHRHTTCGRGSYREDFFPNLYNKGRHHFGALVRQQQLSIITKIS